MAQHSVVILYKGTPTEFTGILLGNSMHISLLCKYNNEGSLGTATFVVTNIGGNLTCCKVLCFTSTDTIFPSKAFLIYVSRNVQHGYVASSNSPTLPSNNGVNQK